MRATIAEVEAKLRAAMDAAKGRGCTIKPGGLIRFDLGQPVACCAIGAVVFAANIPDGDPYLIAATKLGVTRHFAIGVARGFDEIGPRARDDQRAYGLGRRLRADYLGL